MNLHLNPFDKAKIKKEEEARKKRENEIENQQLEKMLEKLSKMQKDEAQNSINSGSAQVLASSTFKGVLHDDKNSEKIEQKRYQIPDVFIKTDENPDFVIDQSRNGLDEHDFLMYSSDNKGEGVAETQKKLLSELKSAQANQSQTNIKNLLNINDSDNSSKGALDWRHRSQVDDIKTDLLLEDVSSDDEKRKDLTDVQVKETPTIEKTVTNRPHFNPNSIRDIKHSNEYEKTATQKSVTKYKEVEERKMEFDKDKFINDSQDITSDYTSNDDSVNFIGSDTETITGNSDIIGSLTKQWEGNLNEKINSNLDGSSQKFSYEPSSSEQIKELQRKMDKIIADEKSDSDDEFDYDKEAFGINSKTDDDFDTDSYISKTMQEDEIMREPEEVIDFFKIDENDMSFALNLIKGMDSNKSKLTTRDGLLKLLRNEPRTQETVGIIGNRQYLQEAYMDLKRQLSGCFFIHLNLRKMYMYSSPVLFLMKHFISQLPEISVDDKKILWKRCANLLSATKFASTKYSEELIFDRELAITDPITNIKREISKVLNAYDLNEIKFILIVDEIRGIDDDQFLNCISFLTLVFENLFNFRLVFEIDSSFIKINVKSTKLKLGLSMIDHYSAQSKVLIGTNLDSSSEGKKDSKNNFSKKEFEESIDISSDSFDRTDSPRRAKYSMDFDNRFSRDYDSDEYPDERHSKEVFTTGLYEDNYDDDSRRYTYSGEETYPDEETYSTEEDSDEYIETRSRTISDKRTSEGRKPLKRTIEVDRESRHRSHPPRHDRKEERISRSGRPRLRSIERGEEYEYKHSPRYDQSEEKKLNKREIRMSRGMEIKPIRTGDADKYDFSSKTLEFAKVSDNEKPKTERRFGKLTVKQPSEKKEVHTDKKRLLGEVDLDYSDTSNPIQMVNDGSGYKFKRKEYVSSYVKQVNNLERDEIDEILNKTNNVDFEDKVGTINIRENLARKRSAKLRYEEETLGKESKFSKKANEDDFTKFLRPDKRK